VEVHVLDELDELKASWAALGPLASDVEQRVDASLEAPYVAASNMIEDKHALGLEETEVFLERALTSAGRRLEDFIALERHRDALREVRAKARAGAPLTLDLIRSLHLELTRGLKDKDYGSGEWKNRPSRTAIRRGRPMRYAAPEQVQDLMRDLVAGYESLAARAHPLEAITWFAYHFHLIQPFNESNGRVQRLVTSFQLLKAGYRELVVEPRDRQAYLSALSSCNATVPPDRLAPLYPGISTQTLVEFFAECVARTLEGLLDTAEGRAPREVKDVARGSNADQRALVANLEKKLPELAWRHKAAVEIRRFQERLDTTLEHAKDDGPLYSIEVEPSQTKKDHAADELLRAALPSGGAGIMGEAALTLRPNPTASIPMPAPRRLVISVVASRIGLQLVTRWAHETRAIVRAGPGEASQWSQASLERHLAERIDTARREYDAEIVELNRAANQNVALKGVTVRRVSLAVRIQQELAGSGPARGKRGARAREDAAARARQLREERAEKSAERSKLGGIRPAEPPVSL
jgi:hypothetical protein